MIVEVLYSVQDAHTWLLDFGATLHITPNMEWFSNYSARRSGTVWLSNGEECKIAGIGKVPIQLPNGNVITLHQVWHVPPLKRSLVSINILVEDRYWMTLNESAWTISRGNPRIRSGHKYINLYALMTINLEGAMNDTKKTLPEPMAWPTQLYVSSQTWSAWWRSATFRSSKQRRTSTSIVDMGNRPEVCTLSTMR